MEMHCHCRGGWKCPMHKTTEGSMMEKFSHTPGDDSVRYQVGDLTMAHVFEPTNIQNLSDMQAVLDAVEVALVGKVELMDALRTADAAIKEMFRYYDGGETRGSYDGKPERAQLRKAGYATSRAIAKAMGDKS